MAGYFTDSRSLATPVKRTIRNNSGQDRSDTVISYPDSQKTTSYRSNRVSSDKELVENFTKVTKSGLTVYNNDPYDTGHTFDTVKRTSKLSHEDWYAYDPQGLSLYRGPLILGGSGVGAFPVVPNVSSDWIGTFGGRAIGATAPTKPVANLSVFLGEFFSDGLPSISDLSFIYDKANRGRKIGDEYLNVMFGWVPFMSDLRKLLTAVTNTYRIGEQMRRDSGRLVRRQFDFPTEVKENSLITVTTNGTIYPFDGEIFRILDGNQDRRVDLHSFKKEKVTFRGAYTYYLDMGDELMNKLHRYDQLAQKLLGFKVTPEALWELAPWSWLADWVTDIGQIMTVSTLLNGDSNLVIRYGYLMRHSVYEDTYTASNFRFKSGGPGTVSNTLRTERKERFRATPFGFNFDMTKISDLQVAILAALGLSGSGERRRAR